MKRRLLSLLTLTALILSFCVVPVRAADQKEVQGEWKNGKFTVVMNIPGVTSATLLAAAYENGRMTQVQTTENVKNGETVTFDGLKETYLVRVFAVDPKSSQPLCEQEEVKNPDALVVYQGTVTLPTADDTVTAALSSALDAYVEAQLALERYDAYFRSAAKPSGDSGTGQSLAEQAVMPASSPFPARPDRGGSYPITAPVSYAQSVQQAAAVSCELSCQGGPESKKEPTAQDCWRQVTYAAAVLNAAAETEAARLQSEVRAMEAASLMAGPSREQLEWAQAISDHYDAIKSNRKLAQLAQDMGCDARRAYNQLVMAQNILQGHYANIEGDLNEFWEKTMIATKAGCKVGLFVCATIATGGAAAASATASAPLGYITAGQAAGIVVGGVDATLEVTTAGAKIILGPDSKAVKGFEERTKPLSDALLVYGLFTGGGDTAGEKLAFLGDLYFRGKELYDNFTLKKDNKGNITADVLTLKSEDGKAVKELAEELLEADTGFDQKPGDKTAEEVLKEFTEDRKSDDETLQEILDEADPENPRKLKDAVKDFNEDVNEKIEKDYPEDDDQTPIVTEKPPRIWQGFDENGNLYEERCTDSDGSWLWSKYYDTETGLLTSEVSNTGTEGSRIQKWTRYYATQEELADTGGVHRVKDIFYYQEDEYGRFQKPWYGQPHLSYYENGVLAERKTADSSEVYDSRGQLSEVHYSDGPNISTTYSYYTAAPAECKFDPTGHLMLVQTVQTSDDPLEIPHVLYKRMWEVRSMPIENGTLIGHGLRMTDWVGTESDFEVYITEPNE